MSLINDAIKRARESGRRSGGAGPIAPLQPVDYGSRPKTSLRLILAGFVLCSLTLAGFSVWQWRQESVRFQRFTLATRPSPSDPVTSHPAAAREEASPPAAAPLASRYGIKVSTSIVQRVETPAPGAIETTKTEPPPAKPEVATPGTDPIPAPPASPPASRVETNVLAGLKLQSIIYRLNKPAAVINGTLLSVGERVQGARVTRITRNAVTLEWNNRSEVLKLPDI
jgi:hypothetical protein